MNTCSSPAAWEEGEELHDSPSSLSLPLFSVLTQVKKGGRRRRGRGNRFEEEPAMLHTAKQPGGDVKFASEVLPACILFGVLSRRRRNGSYYIVISFDIRSPREERYLRRAFMAFMKSGGTQQSLFLEAPLCMVVHTAHTGVPYNFYVFRRRFRCFIAAAAIFGAGDRENRDNCSGSRFAKICCSNYRKETFFRPNLH